ncbi:bifunctional 3-(3-hydroxy-phenyl)propionate/3-hydroxycinnamic acid hydroxylase MhpA [Xylophilus sp.]|uniref:bifunctional 3-(3-hydroxy-phenyl)propionate/3-hydroxycinnamic acid hydroxylase MhpA n=1 Tax=Xylophilus sp. TaxID=2653893 RepID=UPI0013BA7E90|nr:bifunctional 3-(3-hydroxy-phenyl)propionate/3-hydroxycinnamic acid hydroxylase [Xylophilus sp.]KAF1043360.1 MAG: 3-(3-hydroxy-phenyl)propionate/3-hydroxycinnamic acid hydroxylase [Xylophilus sp.]
MTARFDVLIVGYGPAGATAANLLGQRGFKVAVVETAPAIYDKPRAITADQEAMRVFQACGLADEIARNTCPHPGTDFLGVEGQVIKRFYPQPSQPLAWEPTWMFVQPELEAVLRRGAARFAHVQVFLEHEFLGLRQTADGVDVQVRRLADGALLDFEVRYVIACDGARSPVRRQLDGQIEDLAFDEWWIVVDAWLRGQASLPHRCVQYCRPSRPGTYIVGPGDLRRWEIKMLPGESPSDFASETAVRKVLSQFTDVGVLELCRLAVYRLHALVARQWRFGRVFLMGDAAHQMPPFLGQGLCAAIRDAVNLAWKLEAVERHGAAPSLLDSYADERKPHVRTIVRHAKSFGLIIGELDEAAARVRDERLQRELAHGKAETVRQKFIPGLETGLIDLDERQAPGRAAGALFVQPWVQLPGQDGYQRLDDLTARKFLLISDSPAVLAGSGDREQSFWQRIGGLRVLIGAEGQVAGADVLVLRERDGVFTDWLRQSGARAVVVRPDHYVYGAADTPQQLRRLLDRLERAWSDVGA